MADHHQGFLHFGMGTHRLPYALHAQPVDPTTTTTTTTGEKKTKLSQQNVLMCLVVDLYHSHERADVTGAAAVLDAPSLNPLQYPDGDVLFCFDAAFVDASCDCSVCPLVATCSKRSSNSAAELPAEPRAGSEASTSARQSGSTAQLSGNEKRTLFKLGPK
ncbi:hypothetical protein EYF80_039607 [Liparis tanakae]|uniref:Uncharacterized protein n=1 Tax=Liparis tanakae TaxID=230148 RepID=A0A4Z2GB88_9TELE|nr:hypothetical protein EYF80_039607 [Liparis tanakae]